MTAALIIWLSISFGANAQWRESKRILTPEERWERCLDDSPACQIAPDIEIEERQKSRRQHRKEIE